MNVASVIIATVLLLPTLQLFLLLYLLLMPTVQLLLLLLLMLPVDP